MEAESQPDVLYFSNKRVLLIGASGSVGKACAIWLLNHGAKLALVSRKLKEIQSIATEFPSQCACIKCDLISDQEQFDMVGGVIEVFGGIDILIYCAGVIFENDLESTYPQDHDYLIDINLRAFFHISQLCSLELYKSKGCIVTISTSKRPQPGMISYCMSKAGLNMLTKALALELAPVRVNAIAPGFLDNSYLESVKMPSVKIQAAKAHLREKNPLKRLGRVDEVVKAIIFLCSNKAKKMTGQILNVDGGLNITNSCYVNWEISRKMNSKFLASDLKTMNKFSGWVRRNTESFMSDRSKSGEWINEVKRTSNWFTELADAHIKIYENYEKIEEEDDYLGIIENSKITLKDIVDDPDGNLLRISQESPPGIKYQRASIGYSELNSFRNDSIN